MQEWISDIILQRKRGEASELIDTRAGGLLGFAAELAVARLQCRPPPPTPAPSAAPRAKRVHPSPPRTIRIHLRRRRRRLRWPAWIERTHVCRLHWVTTPVAQDILNALKPSRPSPSSLLLSLSLSLSLGSVPVGWQPRAPRRSAALWWLLRVERRLMALRWLLRVGRRLAAPAPTTVRRCRCRLCRC